MLSSIEFLKLNFSYSKPLQFLKKAFFLLKFLVNLGVRIKIKSIWSIEK